MASCSRDPEVAKRQYLKSGDEYAAQGKLKEAIIQYRNAVQQDARFGEGRYKLAEALAKTGDTQGAYREYIRAADLLPKDVDAQVKAGVMNLLAGQFEDARARADKALALKPTSIEGHVLRGNALAGLKDFEAAVAQIEEALKLDPERSLTYGDLAYVQTASGNFGKAEQAYKQAISLDPKSINVHLALANFYWSSGKRAEAEQVLKEALAVDPKNVAVNRALAYLYVTLNRRADAEAPIKLVAEATGDSNARILLAELYRVTGREPLALQVLDALAADPASFALARTRKAAILAKDGRKQEAYAVVAEVLAKEPKNTLALLARAELLANDKDFDQALKLAQAAAADPSSVGARFAIGQIQAARGQLEEARTAYNDVLKLAPRFIQADIELSRISLTTNKPQDALRFAEAALVLQPRNAEATMLKARALIASGNVVGAEPLMRLLAANFPNAPNVQAQLGSLYVLQKDTRAARVAYERAVKVDSGNVEALTGLTALDFADKKGPAARARIDGALGQHPDSTPLMLLAARTQMAGGDQAAAERTLRRVVEVEPSNLDGYTMLGQLFTAEHRLDEAVAEFKQVAARDPKSIMAYSLVGILLEMQNKRPEARQQYEQALAIDSRAAVAANNLAMVYLDTGGNPDVALQLAQTAKSQLPDNPDVSDTLGWAYYKKGLASLAIAPLRESVAKNPKNSGYLGHLGLAYARNGQLDEAEAALKRALAGGQNFPDAKEASDTLASLSTSNRTKS